MMQSDDLPVTPLVPDRGTTHDQPVTDASPQPSAGHLLALPFSRRSHRSRLPVRAPGWRPLPRPAALRASTMCSDRPHVIGPTVPEGDHSALPEDRRRAAG